MSESASALPEPPSRRAYAAAVLGDAIGFAYARARRGGRSGVLLFGFFTFYGFAILTMAGLLQVEHFRERTARGLDGSAYADLLFPHLVEAHLQRSYAIERSFQARVETMRADVDMGPWFAASSAAFADRLPWTERAVTFDAAVFGLPLLDQDLGFAVVLARDAVASHAHYRKQAGSLAPEQTTGAVGLLLVVLFAIPMLCWLRAGVFLALGVPATAPARARLLRCSAGERMEMPIVLLALIVLPAIETVLTWALLGIEPSPRAGLLASLLLPESAERRFVTLGAYAYSVAGSTILYGTLETLIVAGFAVVGRVPYAEPIANAASIAVLLALGAAPVAVAIAVTVTLAATWLRGRIEAGLPARARRVAYAVGAACLLGTTILGTQVRADRALAPVITPEDRARQESFRAFEARLSEAAERDARARAGEQR